MSDLELKRKETLTKLEVAKRLSAFAKALASGDDVELEMGGTSMSLRVADDVRVEFERYVRELVDVPTVQEVKGGNTITVARLDFETLREAIEKLAPDDKEQLLGRVASAERKVETKKETPTRRTRK